MYVQMPAMDGLTATSLLRQREHGSQAHQLVIALTAHALKGDEDRCLAAWMDGYLTEPIQPGDLTRFSALPAAKTLATHRRSLSLLAKADVDPEKPPNKPNAASFWRLPTSRGCQREHGLGTVASADR
jgi:DNA-binding NarL/FixJ family response regulator